MGEGVNKIASGFSRTASETVVLIDFVSSLEQYPYVTGTVGDWYGRYHTSSQLFSMYGTLVRYRNR